ncbi:hypothetical protein [Kaistella rhinocerotis]|uniref:hypothetical protein n=1 Tax=Kaistella rhinocerotis TaxID=3026437 RepID=UPI00255482D1|nr:hypothetical protein [Kaistella sp. Ran72]
MEHQQEKISREALLKLIKTGLTVLKLPKTDGVKDEMVKYRISRKNTAGTEEFVEIFTEDELIEMLEVFKII